MSRIPYMSKRRNIKALTHALAIHTMYGPPVYAEGAYPMLSRHTTWCVSCATMIEPGQTIAKKSWFDQHGTVVERFVHDPCPINPIQLLINNLESHDDIVVVEVHPNMQGGRCFGCDAMLTEDTGYRAYGDDGVHRWYCSDCVKR